MQLIAEDGREILRFSAWEADPRERPHVPQDMLQSMKRNLETVQSNRVAYIAGDSRAKMEVAIYAAKVKDVDGNDAYLCITSSLAPVDATASVLKNQLVIVTIISLAFAFALSYFIAQHIARPISKITKTAGQLAKGNYDVVFEEGDYTEINNLAKVLNYTTKELKKTNELRRDLMANVSHDLRTPLTIIKSYAEMIRDISGNNPEKRTNHANVIVKESDRLSLLVNDILDLSKMEAGTMPLKKSLFDLAETVYGILHQFRVLEESEGYIFRVECEAGMMIYADRHRIEQVIYNLVSNAVNYTGEDKTVYVSAFREGDFAKVAVRDTGKGIPPQEQSLVWERYYRASEGRTRVQHGSGIGLSIVKNILLQHEAEHGVISQVGKGSEFWFKTSAGR